MCKIHVVAIWRPFVLVFLPPCHGRFVFIQRNAKALAKGPWTAEVDLWNVNSSQLANTHQFRFWKFIAVETGANTLIYAPVHSPCLPVVSMGKFEGNLSVRDGDQICICPDRLSSIHRFWLAHCRLWVSLNGCPVNQRSTYKIRWWWEIGHEWCENI